MPQDLNLSLEAGGNCLTDRDLGLKAGIWGFEVVMMDEPSFDMRV